MKKSLFILLALFLSIDLMAQTLVTDQESGLEYLDDGKLYIDVGSAPITTINGKGSNIYFVPDGGLRSNWRNNISDTRLNGQAKWYKEYLDEITTFALSNNAYTSYKGIEYFRNLTTLTIPGKGADAGAIVDLSKNTKLTTLTVPSSNNFKSLDISNTKITNFTLPTGKTDFTFTAKNSALTSLNIASSNVSKLDLSGLANLTTLTTTTSGNNYYLKELNIVGTDITSLDLTKYTVLEKVIFDHTKITSWGTSGQALNVPSGFKEIRSGNTTTLLKSDATELTIDVTDYEDKHVDVSDWTNLTSLHVIGATGVTLPPDRTTFTLNGTGSPDLVVDFAEQEIRNKLTNLTLINVNQADISSCAKLTTLTCQGKGTEWGDGTDGHKGLICNTDATDGSWTLPELVTIKAQGSGVQKLNLKNAAEKLRNLNISKSTMKELYIPNHTNFSPTGVQNISSNYGFSLGYSSVDTLNYYTDSWKKEGEFEWNQLQVLDISGCNFSGEVLITGNDLNRNESPLRKFNANGCNAITKVQIFNAKLDTIDAIDVRNCINLQRFWVEQSRLKSVDLTGCDNLVSFMGRRNSFDGDFDFLTVPSEGRTEEVIAKLQTIQVNGGSSGSIMMGADGKEKAIFRDMFTNKIRSINTSYLGEKLQTLGVADNLLQTLEIHDKLTGLTRFECDNNMLLTLDLTNLPTNLVGGDWGWDMTGRQRMQVGFLNVEEVKGNLEDEDEKNRKKAERGELDWVALPLPNGGGFEHLLDNTVKLFPTIEDAMAGTNEIAEEANPFMGTIEDFNREVGHDILCPTGHVGEHLFLHSQNEIMADAGGKIVDQDLYDKVLIYKYNTGFNGGAPKGSYDNHIEIRAHIWPYILNINPVGKESGSSTTGIDYYVATLCLDYDAVIPNGVTLHVPVGVKEGYKPKGQPDLNYVMQFDMKEVGRPGMVLPKNTPVVVKSTQAAGLYSFQTAWDFNFKGWEDYRQPAIKEAVAKERGCSVEELYPILHGVDEDNIIYKPEYDSIAHPDLWVGNDPEVAGYLAKNLMCGTQETMPCARKSILALGLQNAPGPDGVASLKVGFWRLNALSLPAHRCYILPEKLQEAMEEANLAGAKDGGLFYFGEYDTTAIRTIETEVQSPQKDDVVYDLQGRRITGKPVPGIYIVNGKKVVIK